MADSVLSLYVPDGYDPSKHAFANTARGYEFRPRQCAGEWCHKLFIPKTEGQVLCAACVVEGRPIVPRYINRTGVVDMMRLTAQKKCRRCGKTFAPKSNGQKDCAECIPITVRENAARYRAKRSGNVVAIKPPAKAVAVEAAPAPRRTIDNGAALIGSAIELLTSKQVRELTLDLEGGISVTLRRTFD